MVEPFDSVPDLYMRSLFVLKERNSNAADIVTLTGFDRTVADVEMETEHITRFAQ